MRAPALFVTLVLVLLWPARGVISGETRATSPVAFASPADSAHLVDTLRERIRWDIHDYQARVDLGDILGGSNDIELRREAMEALTEARLIDDSDPELWIKIARLQERRGFRRESRQAYRRAVAMAPERSDVWDELGHHEFRRFQKTKQFAFYDKAVTSTDRALACDPRNISALRQAVRLAYIAGDNAAVDSLCTAWERAAPDDGWALMVRGLLYAETEAWELAMRSFEKGLARLPERLRKPFFRLGIVNPAEEKLRQAAAPDTMQYFEDYWRWRDPTPADDINERLVEHYRRMVQAELLFSLDYLDLRGWEHDPGEMIVRYGLPPGWTYRSNVVRGPEIRLMPRSPFSATSIYVAYGQTEPPMFFTFVDYNLSGRYITMINGFPSDDDFFLVATPSLYESLYEIPELSQEAELWRFVDGDGRGRLELAVALSAEDWPPILLNQPHRLASKLTVYDENWETEDASVGSWAVFETDDLGRLVGLFELSATEDSVIVGLETEDREGTAHAGAWITLPPQDAAKGGPVLSDLAFVSRVSFKGGGGQYGRGAGSALPNPGHRYRVDDAVGISFEAYGLTPDSTGTSRARIRISVARETKRGFFNVLLRRGQSPPEAELAFDVSAYGTRLNQLLSIDVPPLDPGPYVFQVEVEDLITERSVKDSGTFVVIEPGEVQ